MTPEEQAASEIVDRLEASYNKSVQTLREDIVRYLDDRTPPNPVRRTDGSYAYPELRIIYNGQPRQRPAARSYATLHRPGTYTVTITRPSVFRAYLIEQLSHLLADYVVEIYVDQSRQEMPFPYVLDGSVDLSTADIRARELAEHFPTTELARMGDHLVDGYDSPFAEGADSLALFDALRTDFSLARLKHYTGTPPEHVQNYILFTNYHRYVDAFVNWAVTTLEDPNSPYRALSCAGGTLIERASLADAPNAASDGAWRKYQMPAYHLIADDGNGISLINIGVGPSNAKTICDHLAVLRPQAWLMIGHCGGLRGTQKIGDYVLAHAYLRDDHVLDAVLPTEIPIPSIAEVQRALYDAAKKVTGETGAGLKERLRTGTVVTTDDRNWELRYRASAFRINQSRAVAIDMESATVSAQGFRFRVPYGTLLCVSDMPLHGEIKLPGQANTFYERAVREHIEIGIEAVAELRAVGSSLHSRKLRAFNEPPFR